MWSGWIYTSFCSSNCVCLCLLVLRATRNQRNWCFSLQDLNSLLHVGHKISLSTIIWLAEACLADSAWLKSGICPCSALIRLQLSVFPSFHIINTIHNARDKVYKTPVQIHFLSHVQKLDNKPSSQIAMKATLTAKNRKLWLRSHRSIIDDITARRAFQIRNQKC